MWKLVCGVLFVVSIVAVADPIQFDEVNAGMSVIADAVVFGDDMVDYARPEFDTAFSDLKAEKIKYSLKGSIKNSPWVSGLRSEVTATSSMVADRTPNKMGISADSEATIKTDTLAMLRYGATLAIRKAKLSGKYAARIMNNLKQTSEIKSLTDFKNLQEAGRAISLEAIQDELNENRERLACLKDGSCTSSLNSSDLAQNILWTEQRISDLLQVEKAVLGIKIEAFPSEGQAKLIKIEINHPETDKFKWNVKPTVTTIEITEESFKLSASGFAKLEKRELDKLKSELTDELAKIQSGDSEEKERIFHDFEHALAAFKNAVRGEAR